MSTFHLALGFLFLMFLATPLLAQDEFYYLVLLWPGAYCAQSKCCLPTTGAPKVDFFVQSFQTWSKTSQQAETKCSSEGFYIDQLEDLKTDLNDYWSNIRCPSNNGIGYWRQAWKTYGVCSELSEKDYFKTALDLRSKVDVLGHLQKKGIEPSLLYIYGLSEIKSAIAEGIGAEPLIRCSKDAETKIFQLYQIYICVDKDGETIIDCPVKQQFTCSDEVLFRTFDTNQLKETSALDHAGATSSFISTE